MSNSALVTYTRKSPNYTKMANKKNTHIVIHHAAGVLSVKTIGSIFASSSRQASSNYGVDDDNVGLYVDECNRSWATANREIDSKAVTIEVSNSSTGGNWPVSAKTMAKLIDLCVDICKRNGIKKLNYTGDKSGNLHMHCWYASTACPGPYLKSKFSYIASEVNKKLGATTATKVNTNTIYRVRKSWTDKSSQVGAYAKLDNAKKVAKKNKGYKVYDASGKCVYDPWTSTSFKVKITAKDLNIRTGPGTNYKSKGYIKPGVYTIVQASGKWGKLKSGAGWIHLDYAKKI